MQLLKSPSIININFLKTIYVNNVKTYEIRDKNILKDNEFISIKSHEYFDTANPHKNQYNTIKIFSIINDPTWKAHLLLIFVNNINITKRGFSRKK